MSFRFEKLNVWQDSRNFIKHIYSITRRFPSEEKFGLTDQIRRASVSVALNITEGSDRKSDTEFRRFLRMSITSLEEVVTGLYIALDQKYITQKQFGGLYEESNLLAAGINALVKSLNAVDRRQSSQ
ncbi:MAG: four helix bundle protein [Candidatus Curtissbacteria bacterium]